MATFPSSLGSLAGRPVRLAGSRLLRLGACGYGADVLLPEHVSRRSESGARRKLESLGGQGFFEANEEGRHVPGGVVPCLATAGHVCA